MNTENLKALIAGKDMTLHQKADAMVEYQFLVDRLTDLEATVNRVNKRIENRAEMFATAHGHTNRTSFIEGARWAVSQFTHTPFY